MLYWRKIKIRCILFRVPVIGKGCEAGFCGGPGGVGPNMEAYEAKEDVLELWGSPGDLGSNSPPLFGGLICRDNNQINKHDSTISLHIFGPGLKLPLERTTRATN